MPSHRFPIICDNKKLFLWFRFKSDISKLNLQIPFYFLTFGLVFSITACHSCMLCWPVDLHYAQRRDCYRLHASVMLSKKVDNVYSIASWERQSIVTSLFSARNVIEINVLKKSQTSLHSSPKPICFHHITQPTPWFHSDKHSSFFH